MSLIELHPEFSHIVRQLSRIADALERAFPLPLDSPKIEPATEDDMIVISDAKLWEKEQEDQAKNT